MDLEKAKDISYWINKRCKLEELRENFTHKEVRHFDKTAQGEIYSYSQYCFQINYIFFDDVSFHDKILAAIEAEIKEVESKIEELLHDN